MQRGAKRQRWTAAEDRALHTLAAERKRAERLGATSYHPRVPKPQGD